MDSIDWKLILEYTIEMKELQEKYGNSPEEFHIQADGLLCELLNKLGAVELVKIFRNTHKWYS